MLSAKSIPVPSERELSSIIYSGINISNLSIASLKVLLIIEGV